MVEDHPFADPLLVEVEEEDWMIDEDHVSPQEEKDQRRQSSRCVEDIDPEGRIPRTLAREDPE